MITLINVSKRYKKKLFSNFSYQFDKGNIYGIIGPSGCGKSTLLSMMANKIKNYKGKIYYNNIDIKTLKNYTFLDIGYVYQDYQLFDDLTVLDNITLHFKIKNIDYKPHIYKIKTLLKYFKISHLTEQKVKYMSGGEKQRIAIIKALIKDPNILLFDEPTSALDNNTINLLLNYLNNIKKDRIIIIVTHDLNVASMCDEVINFNKLENQQTNKVIEKKIKEKKIKFSYLNKLYQKVLTSKKVFSYISTTILSFGLISISLSFVIKDFINDIVDFSFSTFNTNQYVTIKAKDEKNTVDFSSINIKDIDYIYYEGIASDDKKEIKDNSIIDSVYFNDFSINDTLFIFDNYLSNHMENFCVYVPKSKNGYVKELNYLTINYLNKNILISIDKIYQSDDDNFYIYCNNVSYLYRYFLDNDTSYDVYKYFYSKESNKLYEHLCNTYIYSDYLFYHYEDNNIIQIIENDYSRITKDILDIDFIYADFIHTYIDYDSGLIYLLDDNNYQVVIDESICNNKIAISSKINTNQKYIKLFDKNYEIESIKKEDNYNIIYMNKNTFKNLNESNFKYVGIIYNDQLHLINNNEHLLINKDLFDGNNISSFKYISCFVLFFSILIIILAFLSTITIFNINFIGKKKDIKLLSNMGIYDNVVISLMIKDPLINIIYCSIYGAVFYIFSKWLISVIYQSLSSISLPINVSITMLIMLLITPILLIMPVILMKSYRYLRNNIKNNIFFIRVSI